MADTQQPQNDLMPVQSRVLSYQEIEKIGRAFVASNMFGRDVDRISVAITKIMAGQELGLAPFASMRAVHIIDGNATLSANTMAGMVKSSNRYDYTVDEKTAERCAITFYETRYGKRVKLGTETFDIDEARQANLLHKTNWKNYPKAMLFARCMSNGVRTFAPDVFNGMAVYTPDELEPVKVDSNAKIIEHEPVNTAAEFDDADTTNDALDVVVDPDEVDNTELALPEEKPEDDLQIPIPNTKDPVTDEFKAETTEMLDQLGLKSMGKQRLIKQATGRLVAKSDADWRNLRQFINIALAGEAEIPDDWIAGVIDSHAEAPKRDLE